MSTLKTPLNKPLRFVSDKRVSRAVKIWLVTGLIMIFFQIVIGGVTRLTGSGLSITRWDIVTGAVPPLSEASWQEAFDLYQQTPQYHKINQGMTLGDFKFIYFWEYFHRLWARLMFVVFVIPFGWFWWKGMLSRRLLPKLLILVGLAGLEGFFGWIMVASGLIHRPWVNAYNLTLHLCMGILIFGYLLWIAFIAFQPKPEGFPQQLWRKYAWAMTAVAFGQIALGAMMSGTKAGLLYPTWPTMNGAWLPGLLFDGSLWSSDSFTHYDTNPFVPTLIQFLHRNTAYVLTIMVLYFAVRVWARALPKAARRGLVLLICLLFVQVLLGIFTLINCRAHIPVDLGVLHQAGAVLLLGALLFLNYQTAVSPVDTNVEKPVEN